MKVRIIYCNSWNYGPQAARVAEEIKTNFADAEVSTEVGSGGNFVVELNGEVIFSKKDLIACQSERFPENEEITKLINAKIA